MAKKPFESLIQAKASFKIRINSPALMNLDRRIACWLARAVIIGCACALGASYPFLSRELHRGEPVRGAAFHIAYGLVFVAAAWLVIQMPSWLDACVEAARRMPFRSLLLPANVVLTTLILLYIFTRWGVVGILLLGSTCFLLYSFFPERKRREAVLRVVRKSWIVFGIIYLFLAAGEVYLRSHPRQVGSGGDGNPALNQIYSGMYTYNSLGLRDDEFTRNKPEGTFRILALGDSFAFGQGVPFEKTFPQQIEARLNAGRSGTKFEVINAGRQGVDTFWELEYLKSEGLDFSPDLVVVQFYLNDIVQKPKAARSPSQGGIKSTLKRPFHRSYVMFFLRDRFDLMVSTIRAWTADKTPPDYFQIQAQVIAQNAPAWRDFGSALDEFGALSRERSLPIVFVLYPHPGEPHDAMPRIHEAVALRCRDAGLPVIDLFEDIARIDPEEQIVSDIDHHPSPRYHALAADRLVESLQDWALLPE